MNTYIYRVRILRVVDGDTVDVDIDLGFDAWLMNQRIRLTGIDAPETRTRDLEEKKAGLDAKRWLQGVLGIEPERILLRSNEFEPRGKFGRILGTFLVKRLNGEWLDINRKMVDLGLVKLYTGGA